MGSKTVRARKIIKNGAFYVPSPEEIERAKTPAGAWTAKQLAKWGVPWPPQAGWRDRLYERWAAGDAPAVDRPTRGQISAARAQRRRETKSLEEFDRLRDRSMLDRFDPRAIDGEG